MRLFSTRYDWGRDFARQNRRTKRDAPTHSYDTHPSGARQVFSRRKSNKLGVWICDKERPSLFIWTAYILGKNIHHFFLLYLTPFLSFCDLFFIYLPLYITTIEMRGGFVYCSKHFAVNRIFGNHYELLLLLGESPKTSHHNSQGFISRVPHKNWHQTT